MPPPSKTIPTVDRSIHVASHLGKGIMVQMAKTGKVGFMPDHQPVKNRIIVQIDGRRIAYKSNLEYFILEERPPQIEYRKLNKRRIKTL
jgi:hypothetical protein